MGLDFRLRYKYHKDNRAEDFCIIMEGQGRAAFNFLREWVGDERYGENILLSKEDIQELINEAIKQEVGNDSEYPVYKSSADFLDACVKNMHYIDEMACGDPCALVSALLLILGRMQWEEVNLRKNYMEYYIECDW